MTANAIKLYEHADAIQVVEDWIAEHEEEIRAAGGALPAELAELLDAATLGFREKVESVALVVLGFRATAAAIKEEEARLAARRKHYETAAASLSGYLHAQMERAGERKVDGARCTVAVQASPPTVTGELDEQALRDLAERLPGCVVVVPETVRLDRRVALDALRSGETIPGLAVTQGTHLRIR